MCACSVQRIPVSLLHHECVHTPITYGLFGKPPNTGFLVAFAVSVHILVLAALPQIHQFLLLHSTGLAPQALSPPPGLYLRFGRPPPNPSCPDIASTGVILTFRIARPYSQISDLSIFVVL